MKALEPGRVWSRGSEAHTGFPEALGALAHCQASVDRSGGGRAFLQEAEPQGGWEAGKALTQSELQEVHPAGSQASAGQGGAGPRWGAQQAGAGR